MAGSTPGSKQRRLGRDKPNLALVARRAAADGAAMTDRKRAFPPIVDADTRVLILGSLPGNRSLAAGRYYAHPQNQFWRLVGEAIGRPLATMDYAGRLAMLRACGIGLWDAIESAERMGSSDAAIRAASPHAIADLAARLPQLRAIAFNGAKAAGIAGPQLAGSGLALLPLPSSSPLHTIGVAAKQPAWNALRHHLAPDTMF